MRSVHCLRLIVDRKGIFLCLLSAVLLIFSFPNANLWIFAWFGFVPLFFALQNKSKLKAFFLSLFTGIIFWFGVIYWLIHVTLPGLIALVLYLALYFGIFGLFVSTISACPCPSGRQALSAKSLIFLPSVWVLLEYLRAHLFTGFGWTLLSHSQYLNLPIIQIADITGAYGVSFLVMMVNVAIWKIILEARSRKLDVRFFKLRAFRFQLLFVIFCFLSVLIYGYFRLCQKIDGQRLGISVIQANIPQERKQRSEAMIPIFAEYLRLSRSSAKEKADLIIWPETAITGALESEPLLYETLRSFAQDINIPLLVGTVSRKNNLYYNSAILVDKNGDFIGYYNKLHLVPFGEYIPLRKIFRFLEAIAPIGDFTRGKEYTIFKLPVIRYRLPIRFSVLICFEDIVPELSRKFVKKGAQFLVNITNDAWFKKTSSHNQHLAASVFRAVENRVYMIRSANTGVSAFIDPKGRVISSLDIFKSGYLTKDIIIGSYNLSFYTWYGDVFILLCLAIAAYSIIMNAKLKVKNSKFKILT